MTSLLFLAALAALIIGPDVLAVAFTTLVFWLIDRIGGAT